MDGWGGSEDPPYKSDGAGLKDPPCKSHVRQRPSASTAVQ
jgi:hypothetical protein